MERLDGNNAASGYKHLALTRRSSQSAVCCTSKLNSKGTSEMNSLTKENTRLGFIGIGNMGSRMAKRLLEHGYQVIAYNRSREAAEALVKFGATVANSIAELASEVDVILSSLTNDDAVKNVYNDPQGVFAYVRRGSAIIEMSTVL